MVNFKTFIEYASEKRILELLIKERVKVALKNKLEKSNNNYRDTDATPEKLSEQIAVLMPARDWVRPRKKDREGKNNKQVLTRSLALTIKKDDKLAEPPTYLLRQKEFIASIIQEVKSSSSLRFSSILIIGKKKKTIVEDGKQIEILRPLCMFTDLKEKILISLMNSYLTEVFDPLLHEEILSYRPLRHYQGNSEKIFTNRDNAMDNLKAYMHRCGNRKIYVAECDIQKFFDSINHDVVRTCFADMAEKLKEKYPAFSYAEVGRIMDAYLNSYSFYKTVLSINDENKRLGINKRFEAPKDKDFIDSGCYTKEEFQNAKSKIGIPQGGAVSGLIANVVLNNVDSQSVLKKVDAERFFSRYGDDILLMHTDKEKCISLINEYCGKLIESKLLYHPLTSVNDPSVRKGDKLRTAYWDIKSRLPFLWGRSNEEEDQADWIGFLGYEMRRTGEIRVRRSSLNDKFVSIKRKYYTGAKTRIARGKFPGNIETEIDNRIERFKTDGYVLARSLTSNEYLKTQLCKLDKYAKRNLIRLLYKIYKNNNSVTKENYKELVKRAMGELNCYRESVVK